MGLKLPHADPTAAGHRAKDHERGSKHRHQHHQRPPDQKGRLQKNLRQNRLRHTHPALWRGFINLKLQFHQVYLNGVFELDAEGKLAQFHITEAPTRSELADVLQQIITCITKLLEKRRLIERDQEDHLQVSLEEDDALARLQAGAAIYRFTLGPNKGKKALTLKTVPETDHNSTQELVAKNSGFSLHAGIAFTGT